MFIIRGVNVFPSQIETALLKVEGALPHYQIVLTREKDLDVMEVQVEVTPEVFARHGGRAGAIAEQAQPSPSKPRSACGPMCGWSSRAPFSAAKARPSESLTSAKCNPKANHL